MAAAAHISWLSGSEPPRHDPDDHIPPVDWQGHPLDCGTCSNRPLNLAGRCELGRACVFDRYAKRIDRFFNWNRSLANDYLGHPYFEVRAVATKHADVFRLSGMIDDPDETVRLTAAMRLPQRLLVRLRNDPDREVRIRVASRLDPAELMSMAGDPDYYVRLLVARRVPEALLGRLADDHDAEVRREVVRRLPMPGLLRMAADPEIAIRRQVAQRLPAGLLGQLAADPAWEVRWEVACRADGALAEKLAADGEEEVAQAARRRLVELKETKQGDGHGQDCP